MFRRSYFFAILFAIGIIFIIPPFLPLFFIFPFFSYGFNITKSSNKKYWVVFQLVLFILLPVILMVIYLFYLPDFMDIWMSLLFTGNFNQAYLSLIDSIVNYKHKFSDFLEFATVSAITIILSSLFFVLGGLAILFYKKYLRNIMNELLINILSREDYVILKREYKLKIRSNMNSEEILSCRLCGNECRNKWVSNYHDLSEVANLPIYKRNKELLPETFDSYDHPCKYKWYPELFLVSDDIGEKYRNLSSSIRKGQMVRLNKITE